VAIRRLDGVLSGRWDVARAVVCPTGLVIIIHAPRG
jgi:drug/metabolite transporter superfamily protein YnfA